MKKRAVQSNQQEQYDEKFIQELDVSLCARIL
jgi:hypothetical protein